jgi:Asp-tRNA(Asn)/Glu-tRNA(Gln) amidotransferase A subunit family amidase
MTGAIALTDLSVRAASDLLHRRAISPVELTEAYLTRIERWNRQVNAYVTIMGDDARATARRAEAELVAGTDRGPLHGIPLGLKDLLATAGVRTSAGSATGLPIGLQIAGRRFDEPAVLRVGHAYEQSTDWHLRRPPLDD